MVGNESVLDDQDEVEVVEVVELVDELVVEVVELVEEVVVGLHSSQAQSLLQEFANRSNLSQN